MPLTGYSKYQKTLSLAGDLLLINLAFLLGYYLRFGSFFNFQKSDMLVLLLICNFSWWVIANSKTFLVAERSAHPFQIASRLFHDFAIHGAVLFLTIVLFKLYTQSRLMVAFSYGIEMVLIFSWRFTFYKLLKNYRRAGYNFRNVIIIGMNENARALYKSLFSKHDSGYRFKGFFDIIPHKGEKYKVRSLDQLEDYVKKENIDEVYCTLSDDMADEIQRAIEVCENNLIRFKMVPGFIRYIKKKVTIDFVDNMPVLFLRNEPLENMWARWFKRMFDIFFSTVVILLVLSWLIPLVALIIKLESKGPVFFKQLRTGKDNKDFYIYKFRSMRVNRHADKKQATEGDARITRFGRFLRKTSIDELPQFLNVFTGSMSIVGPRPHMLQHTLEYSKIIDKYMVRHFVKPGITGWAQVNGARGETTHPRKMAIRVNYDVWYIENWSFALDVFIIYKTCINVLKGEQNAV